MAFKPIVISDFKGLGTRWEPEKAPPGTLTAARNIRFREESVGPRPGLSIALQAPFIQATAVGTVPTISTTCPLPEAVFGDAYNVQLEAIGGTAPYTWTLIDGALPLNLELSATGLISGVVDDVDGTYTFTFQVTDANGLTASKECMLTITTPCVEDEDNTSRSFFLAVTA